ncbi:MAG: molybdopterin molybdotransferase MoeA [Flavitalea sp.]
MTSYENALSILISHAESFGEEYCSLEEVSGRVLAEDVFADRDYPPFNRVAMDGYAIRSSDWKQTIREYIVKETVFAGARYKFEIDPGECYKIMTGAALPESADMVIKVEDSVELPGSKVMLVADYAEPFQHISRKGEDIKKGELLVSKDMYCDPGVVALLAAAGKLTVKVKRNPTVAIITSGNEVRPVDYPISDIEIRNSNLYQLKATCKELGITDIRTFHALDDIEQLKKVFSDAWDADILISCGAVSMGDADHIPEVLVSMGAECLFHKVSIKPGKPIWCGIRPGKKIIFALPGNPFSCRVNSRIFIKPFLNACLGKKEVEVQMEFAGIRDKRTSLDEFFPVTVSASGHVEEIPFNSSGDIRAGVGATGIAKHPAEKRSIVFGDRIDFYAF